MIPGFTETLTRLPAGAPFVAAAEAPVFQVICSVIFAVFLTELAAQIVWLRASLR